jgi:hypothetical protein
LCERKKNEKSGTESSSQRGKVLDTLQSDAIGIRVYIGICIYTNIHTYTPNYIHKLTHSVSGHSRQEKDSMKLAAAANEIKEEEGES